MVYKYIFSSEVRVCTLEGGKILMEVSLSSQLYLPQTVCKEKRSERERVREREEVVQEKKENGAKERDGERKTATGQNKLQDKRTVGRATYTAQ